MAKILCVEDNAEFYLYLTSVLSNHDLTLATSLGDAFQILRQGRESFDLVILDISLPDGNGVKSLAALKELIPLKSVPFVVVSTEDDILIKVAAFSVGADDYILKPPNADELKARIEARLRSSQIQQKKIDHIQVGDLLINSDNMMVEQILSNQEKVPIELTPIEFKILKLIATRPGQVYSRDQLIDQVWGISKYITQRSVDAHISHLRKKLIKSSVLIETVLSMGYKVAVRDNHSF